MNKQKFSIRRAQCAAHDSAEAVRQFHAAVVQPDMALVIFFCSVQYDLGIVASEMSRLFGDVPVIGCTTAGEIGPSGYTDHTIVGASFPAERFSASSTCIGPLQKFDFADGQATIQPLQQRLEALTPDTRPGNSFAFMLIDGLSVREEIVSRALQSALGSIPLVGGSAGDGLNFQKTQVYHAGRFHGDSAVLALVTTSLPISPLITQHFIADDRRVVVTAADAEHRIVYELDGRPAAETYAECLGIRPADLDPARFATSPLAVVIGGTNYVRSISKALPDGSLKFFCAIDEGMVLRITRTSDMLNSLEQSFADLRARIGRPEIVIGCDCILRRLEIDRQGLTSRIAQLLESNRVIGFNTYGEQFRGIHVNQTFTAIAIGGDPHA